MNKQIYIPKDLEKLLPEIIATAKARDPKNPGIGNYFFQLHKEAQLRKDGK